ncbi:hypothetical protein GDO78_016137 [Eleutherodactylus coqui]|uniref:Uncharacterized protein n=1 Tax=Eleutherodactylus coqui TaxID=57060 RepID=A0A8J6EKS2_ELECQ|nr:hypothetical protein GDO78_016137 [Eleutherodactylus coqui]KAG9471025.1 hypothetical protein GDO78_016137 [Eleutherodactylus coqui]
MYYYVDLPLGGDMELYVVLCRFSTRWSYGAACTVIWIGHWVEVRSCVYCYADWPPGGGVELYVLSCGSDTSCR